MMYDFCSSKQDLFLEAAGDGDLHTVDRLLAGGGIDVNGFGHWNATALMFAAGYKLAREWRVYSNTATYRGITIDHTKIPMILTYRERALRELSLQPERTGVVQRLLDAGASVGVVPPNGLTALYCAAFCGWIKSVKLMLASGADLNLDAAQPPALFAAAGNGFLEICQLLLKSGASPGATDENGGTALAEAAFHGHLDVVQLLIAAGAPLDAASQYGYTALMLAALADQTECARTLIDAGAAVDGKWQLTPLLVAVKHGRTEIVRLLLAAGADATVRARGDHARASPSKYMRAKKIDDFLDDEQDNTPLILAVSYGHADCVVALLMAGATATINIQNGGENTALIYAAQNNDTALCQLLMSHGADPLLRNKRGDNSAEWAVSNKNKVLQDLFSQTPSAPIVSAE
jgi:ankyrin repeat protein